MSIFFAAECFDSISQGTRNLCSYNPTNENEPTSSLQSSYLALRLGHVIKKAAMILRGMALRQKDPQCTVISLSLIQNGEHRLRSFDGTVTDSRYCIARVKFLCSQ